MTHKIKVQMFGNFRMDYNGAPFVAEKMHKESQFNRMMQALIHYSDCGIAKDKLEEIVIGERDIDAPHTALRVIVYKTKQKLAQLGLPGKNLVYLEGGIYYWTPDIEIEEDAAEFEKLYNEACALEKQMPHEPESAETVCDERIKEIEDNMLELYIKALYLYKGEFLAAYTGETWIAQEARRYHIMFLDNISYKLDAGLSKSDMQSAATVSDYLMLRVYQGLSRQRERIGDEEAYEQFVREATLKAVDDGWVELIDYLEQLKYAVAGRASAQRNVMFEYQNEAFESFLDTEKAVKCNIIRNILLSDVKIGKDGRLQVIYP